MKRFSIVRTEKFVGEKPKGVTEITENEIAENGWRFGHAYQRATYHKGEQERIAIEDMTVGDCIKHHHKNECEYLWRVE